MAQLFALPGAAPSSPVLGAPVSAAAPAAAAGGDFFNLIIAGMTDPSFLPMGSSKFQFDQSSNWRLEIPADILRQATQNKAKKLGLALFLDASGTAALGQASRMDVKACLLPQAGVQDGATPGWGWKTVGQLSPSLGLSSVCEIDWSVQGIPHAVVLMVTALPAQAPLTCALQTVLDDNAAACDPAAAAAAAGGFGGGGAAAIGGGVGSAFGSGCGGGGGGGGGGGAKLQTHIATLPLNLVGAFIGPQGSNVNQLRAQFQNAKVNVDKNTGHVTTDCQNFAAMGTVVQGWIAQQPPGGAVATGGGGGGSKPRGRGGRRR